MASHMPVSMENLNIGLLEISGKLQRQHDVMHLISQHLVDPDSLAEWALYSLKGFSLSAIES